MLQELNFVPSICKIKLQTLLNVTYSAKTLKNTKLKEIIAGLFIQHNVN